LWLRSDGLLVTDDIPYKVGGGIILLEALATSNLDPDGWQTVATIGFKCLGMFFDAELRCGTQAKYVQ
jgi:hypothetical protein